jgi:vacuolar-type H+-ATPase subunit I/STV1
MIFPQHMKQLVAVVLDRDADRVIRALLDLGVMHFVSVTEVDPGLSERLAAANPRVTEAMIAEIRRRIEGLFSLAEQGPPAHLDLRVEDLRALDLDATDRRLDELAASLTGIRERQQTLQQEILKLEDIRRQLSMFGDLSAGLAARSQFSFLSIQSGTLRRAELPALVEELKNVPSVHLEVGQEGGREDGQATLLLITMKRDDGLVNKILDRHGWAEVELSHEALGGKEEVLADLDGKREGFQKEQEKLKSSIEALLREKRPELERLWANLRLNELYSRIQSSRCWSPTTPSPSTAR